ncbi:hypothetical protein [Chryseobacterium sp.]|uniref:hypothetical protein n=1 Tax=Chryseobacterium sp. TaxID=1871047 RepID=UPI002896D1F0|nr:hypothetical protein [Chryseobacterium sp.]
MNKKQSSNSLSKIASETLRNANASSAAKSLAGSVLSQSHTANQTSKEMEGFASMVLQSNKYSELTKSLAGSVLSQSNGDK